MPRSFTLRTGDRALEGTRTEPSGVLILLNAAPGERTVFDTEGALLAHFGDEARLEWHDVDYVDMDIFATPSGGHEYVAAHYREGAIISPFSRHADLSDAPTADLVVSLADALERIQDPEGLAYHALCRRVAVLWREASRRGVTLG